MVTGQGLTDRLMEQARPFKPTFHFGRMASGPERLADGRWRLATDGGPSIVAHAVVIAAGGGDFVPKRPPIADIEAFQNVSVQYAVRRMEDFRDKDIVIAGGGDSALDWTLNLAPLARSLTLVYHRDGFRASRHSVNRMREMAADGRIAFHIKGVKTLHGADGQLQRGRWPAPTAGSGRSRPTPSCSSSA